MATNGVSADSVTALEAMPNFSGDSEAAQMARQKMASEVKARLTLSPSKMSFVSTGVSTITWQTREEGWQSLDIPIRSLSPQVLQEITDRYRGTVSQIPQKWDEQANTYVPDENAPEAMEWLAQVTEMTISARYDKILAAFDGDIESIDGDRLVWSSADVSIRDRDAALESLIALGIPTQQLIQLEKDIDNLSIKQAMDSAEDFKKKQPQR